MYRLIIKNIKTSFEGKAEGTLEECKAWKDKQLANGTFGKHARQEIKKGQPFAGDYDDIDVLSEEDKETSPSYERAKYSEIETEMVPYIDSDGIEQFREQHKYLGQEIVPAKFHTVVNLKAEYELSEIIDLSIDPDYIKQKDEEESEYNISSGKLIISKIGGLNLRKQREGTFNVEMSNYLQAFTVPFSLLSSGAIDTSLIVVSTLSIYDPYSEEEMNEIKKFHHDAINGRPKR